MLDLVAVLHSKGETKITRGAHKKRKRGGGGEGEGEGLTFPFFNALESHTSFSVYWSSIFRVTSCGFGLSLFATTKRLKFA